MQLIANKDFRYKTRDLRAGASFKADDADVLLLTRTSPPLAREEQPVPPVDPPVTPRAGAGVDGENKTPTEPKPITAARRGRYARRDMRAKE